MIHSSVDQLSKLMESAFPDGGYAECQVPQEKIISDLRSVLTWMRDKLPHDARYMGIFRSSYTDLICFRFRSVDFPAGEITVLEMPRQLPGAETKALPEGGA